MIIENVYYSFILLNIHYKQDNTKIHCSIPCKMYP
jgi:hypothetical protein